MVIYKFQIANLALLIFGWVLKGIASISISKLVPDEMIQVYFFIVIIYLLYQFYLGCYEFLITGRQQNSQNYN